MQNDGNAPDQIKKAVLLAVLYMGIFLSIVMNSPV